MAAPLDASVEAVSLTLPAQRPADVSCAADDVLVFGFPVYAGRVPVLLRDEFAHLEGRGTPAVVVGLYGNRAFDDYRMETLRRLEEEQTEFKDFLDRLRHAKDKEEFDAFMAQHKQRPTPPTDQPQG